MTRFVSSAILLLVCVSGHAATLAWKECTVTNLTEKAMCGESEVLENRAARAGRTIKLRIAVLPSQSKKPFHDPIFIIVGGPGQSALENAASYARLLAPLRKDRAFVFVDQRGTGDSNPLPCDLYSEQLSGSLGDFLPLDAVRRCRTELERVADLRFYTTEQAADDLDDVRAALGYEHINIEAASYGTRVALQYLRRHSQHARSVVLRSISPPWVKQPLHFAEDSQAALEILVQDCKSDVQCNSTFPQFREEFNSVLEKLKTQDIIVELPGPGEGSPPRKISLSRGAFAEKVRLMLYAPEVSSFFPLLIHLAYTGNFTPFAEFAEEMGQQISKLGSNGMYLSVTCAEDVAQITKEEAANTWPGTFLGDYRVRQQLAACALWPKTQLSSDFSAPVRANTPVLLISSMIDPITPPRWAEEVARGLSNSRHIQVPNAGHSPANPCIMSIVQKFITEASFKNIDLQCLATIQRPSFVTELPD